MMELIKANINIDFMGKFKVFIVISALTLVISIGFMLTKGFNLGIDFAGGTVVQVKFNDALHFDEIREALAPVIPADFVVQNFGGADNNEVLIRIVENDKIKLQDLSDNIKQRLAEKLSGEHPVIQRIEQVGPQVGQELRQKAFFAMLYATIGILLYIAIRFQWLFGVGAIISLLHDVVITMGVYSIAGKEFNLTVMAAILTVAGYSLNDTIVIFDRIRENLKTIDSSKSWKEIVNVSVNETLSRTVITSTLTFFAVLSLYIFGGEVINGFALVMMVGIIVGTYSSICIASLFIYLVKTRQNAKIQYATK